MSLACRNCGSPRGLLASMFGYRDLCRKCFKLLDRAQTELCSTMMTVVKSAKTDYHGVTLSTEEVQRVREARTRFPFSQEEITVTIRSLLGSIVDHNEKRAAAVLLLRLRDPHTIGALSKCLRQLRSSQDLVGELLRWICHTPEPGCEPDLIAWVNDTDLYWINRIIAAEALARIGTPSALEALCSLSVPKVAPYYGEDPNIDDAVSANMAFRSILLWFARGCSGDARAVGYLEAEKQGKRHEGVQRAASDALRILNSLPTKPPT